ncbi:MAG: hypothetical protein IRY99_26900 [Isosphaeraceae bacterium]|nr:hypothetical protein [Isosphaeraceae bacterium]
MIEDDLFAILDPALRPLGVIPDVGEEFRSPPLDVLRYYYRTVRLGWMPLVGRALSLVAVVRQPLDLGLAHDGYRTLLARLAMAANGRYPPLRGGRGLTIALTTVVLTPEPIGPDDDATLGRSLVRPSRSRAVPLGLIRLNLGQEAMALALQGGPPGLFPEPEAVADALMPRFRRFVPLIRE